jgi:pimeloyl-ACP methyl ester carboxylesterase
VPDLISCQSAGEYSTSLASTGYFNAPSSGDWETCELFTYGYGDLENLDAQCMYFDVPVFWENEAGEQLELFVKKFESIGPRRGSLWLLAGGPGQSSIDLEIMAYIFAALDDGLDVYLPDHRGTGRSSLLDCAAIYDEDSDIDTSTSFLNCADEMQLKWGDSLAGFSPTQAAQDLGYSIDQFTEPGEPAYVLGISYGTYWLNRYLQLFPDQAAGAIFDSIKTPEKEEYFAQNLYFNQVGEAFLDYCVADEFCREKLGSDPFGKLVDVLNSLKSGHCSEIFDGEVGVDNKITMTYVLGSMIDSFWDRDHIPALIYRLERCNSDDVEVLDYFSNYLFGTQGSSTAESFSGALNLHIVISEMLLAPEDYSDDLDYIFNDAGFMAIYPYDLQAAFASWPVYPEETYFGKWASSDIPILMLNGDLDPRTPISLAVDAGVNFDGANQVFEEIIRGAHSVLVQSETQDSTGYCGIELAVEFLKDPQSYAGNDCLENIKMPDFEGEAEDNLDIWGVEDRYESGGSTTVARSVNENRTPKRSFRQLADLISRRPRYLSSC